MSTLLDWLALYEQEGDRFKIHQNRCLENGETEYLNSDTADVHFLFGEKDNVTSIPAHKNRLATDSVVFEKMFYGEMREPGDIHIRDSTVVAFKEFLKFYYFADFELKTEDLLDVLYLGNKYDVKKCINSCVRSLIRLLDDESVCDQLKLASFYDQKEWIGACEEHIMAHTEAVFDSKEFLECDKKVLAHILKMDFLVCSEFDVFKACMSWVKAKCRSSTDLSMKSVERHLGNSFYDIRLASLTMDQLCTLYLQYESVLTRDIIHITNIIVRPEFPEPKFNKNPRQAKWNAKAIIKCKREVDDDDECREHRDYHRDIRYVNIGSIDDCHGSCEFFYDYGKYLRELDTTEETTFSVNKPLFLGSLSIVGMEFCECAFECTLQTEMEIIENAKLAGKKCKTLVKMNFELKSSCVEMISWLIDAGDRKEILLPHPVLVRPGFFYTIRLGSFPEGAYSYSGDRKTKTNNVSNVMIEFHKNWKHSVIDVLNFNKNQCVKSDEKLDLDAENADMHSTFDVIGNSSKRVPANETISAMEIDVFEALFTADSTEVDDSVNFPMDTIDNENVCAHLNLAIQDDQEQLMEVCEKRIMVNCGAVFGSNGFLECGKKVLEHILKMNVLACAEDEVFKACMAWVKAKSNGADLSIELVELHLGDLYYKIRLASLTLVQLCVLHEQYESVLTRDFGKIMWLIVEPRPYTLIFNKCPRLAKWDEDAIIKCEHATIEYGWDDRELAPNTTEETTFTVNVPLVLGSLSCVELFVSSVCYSESDRNQNLQTEMEIIEAHELDGVKCNILLKMKIELKSSDDGTDILLSHPVLVRPGFYYTIRLGPFPKYPSYFCKCLKPSVEHESNIKIKFHKNYGRSLINVLNFNKV